MSIPKHIKEHLALGLAARGASFGSTTKVVSPSGGSGGGYSSIQDALDSISTDDTIELVSARTNTISVTNGSPIVTGTGTNWVGGTTNDGMYSHPDNLFSVDGSRFYKIRSIDSDTQITLFENYAGSTDASVTSWGLYVVRWHTVLLLPGYHYSSTSNGGSPYALFSPPGVVIRGVSREACHIVGGHSTQTPAYMDALVSVQTDIRFEDVTIGADFKPSGSIHGAMERMYNGSNRPSVPTTWTWAGGLPKFLRCAVNHQNSAGVHAGGIWYLGESGGYDDCVITSDSILSTGCVAGASTNPYGLEIANSQIKFVSGCAQNSLFAGLFPSSTTAGSQVFNNCVFTADNNKNGGSLNGYAPINLSGFSGISTDPHIFNRCLITVESNNAQTWDCVKVGHANVVAEFNSCTGLNRGAGNGITQTAGSVTVRNSVFRALGAGADKSGTITIEAELA